MANQAIIEIYREGRWQQAAVISSIDVAAGHNGVSRLEYCLDYAAQHIGEREASAAGVSCRYPVDFDLHDDSTWPAFLLDILPSGAGRNHWLKRLDLKDADSADWPLLLNGAASPPGNLRVREAVEARRIDINVPKADGVIVPLANHPGFELEEIYKRQEYFIEYAYQNGAQTAGSSDVQGVAPKFLMVKDRHGKWHAEGALDDADVASHWLIKFPRGNTAADRQVLCLEAKYMRLAKFLGLKVYADLIWNHNTLLIPRFDRVVNSDSSVARIGMESLCSLAGVAKYGIEYGGAVSHDKLCGALSRYVTEPDGELLEYIKRDVINIVLGNKDNHPRNTAVLRHESGRVELSPLFDFAPMYLDPAGIARACRWEGDKEVGGVPDWKKVVENLQWGVSLSVVKGELAAFGGALEKLPEIMVAEEVDADVIESRMASIRYHTQQLKALV